jgi:hypothetical protein
VPHSGSKMAPPILNLDCYCIVATIQIKEEYLVKSNQVCARMEIEISDCHQLIAKNVLYCYKDLI